MKWFWQKDDEINSKQEDLEERINAIIKNNITIKQACCNHNNAEIVVKGMTKNNKWDEVHFADDWARYETVCHDCDKVISTRSTKGEYLKQEYKKAKDALNNHYELEKKIERACNTNAEYTIKEWSASYPEFEIYKGAFERDCAKSLDIMLSKDLITRECYDKTLSALQLQN